jgi:NitT/TauT family transport system substrate-binding protein
VGFVFNEEWAEENPEAIRGFLRATAKANELLATSNAEWDRLKPVMSANDPNFTEKTFEALRRRYREGIPERPIGAEEADAKVLYQFLRELGGTKLVGSGTELAPGTFWHGMER